MCVKNGIYLHSGWENSNVRIAYRMDSLRLNLQESCLHLSVSVFPWLRVQGKRSCNDEAHIATVFSRTSWICYITECMNLNAAWVALHHLSCLCSRYNAVLAAGLHLQVWQNSARVKCPVLTGDRVHPCVKILFFFFFKDWGCYLNFSESQKIVTMRHRKWQGFVVIFSSNFFVHIYLECTAIPSGQEIILSVL